MSVTNNHKHFSELRDTIVFPKRPVVKGVFDRFGDMTLADFAQTYIQHDPVVPQERREELIAVVAEEAERHYGSVVGEQVSRQMRKHYFLSTTDHHGPLSHFSFLSAHLVTALLARSTPDIENIIALAGSTVSLNNYSYPAGMMLTRPVDGQFKEYRLPLFSRSRIQKSGSPTLSCDSYESGIQTLLFQRIDRIVQESALKQQQGAVIKNIFQEHFFDDVVLSCKSYSDQVSVVNRRLWNALLQKGNQSGPGMVYLSIENIVPKLLQRFHLAGDKETFITTLTLDSDFQDVAGDIFEGTFGGARTQENKGSFLFWAFPSGGSRRRLVRQKDVLTTEDGTFSVAMTPEGISEALKSGTIVPSTLLNILVFAGYYGITCLGGTQQVNYLTETIQKTKQLLKKWSGFSKEDRDVFTSVRTDALSIYTFPLLRDADGNTRYAHLLDLLLNAGESFWDDIARAGTQMTVGDSLSLFMPELYRIITPKEEQKTALSNLSTTDVAAALDINNQIPFVPFKYE